MEQIVRAVLSEEREQQSSPFISSSHNFKIDMPYFMGEVATCCKGTKDFSIIYKILKDITMGNTVVLNHPKIYKRAEVTRQTYYGFIKRLEVSDLVRKIEWNGVRGEVKYMVNPNIIYNHKKCKSNNMFAENCDLWNMLG